LHEIEFSFLNGNLMVPISHLLNFTVNAALADVASWATT